MTELDLDDVEPPGWDDRKVLAGIWQDHAPLLEEGLSERVYEALIAVANWGFRQRGNDLRAHAEQLRQHILDIDAHATPFGDIPDEPGWVGTYLVTAGALHRALGKVGHSAPKCEAEAKLAELTARAELMAPVVEAARAWYANGVDPAGKFATALVHAVEAYEQEAERWTGVS